MKAATDAHTLSVLIGQVSDNLNFAKSAREKAHHANLLALGVALSAFAPDVAKECRFEVVGVAAAVVGAKRMGFLPDEVVAISAAIGGWNSGVETVSRELVAQLANKAHRIALQALADVSAVAKSTDAQSVVVGLP